MAKEIAPDPSIGQGQAPEGQVAPAPFFNTKYDDGQEEVFNTREDLEKAWKESYLRRKDYTQKGQSLAKEREQVAKEREEARKLADEAREKSKEYTKFDTFLRDRPDVFGDLKRRMQIPPSPQIAVEQATKYADEKYGELAKRLESFESWQKEQELEREKYQLYDKLKTKYPDLKPELLDSRFNELADSGLEGILETILLAEKARDPIELEKKAAENAAAKQEARVMPGSGGTPAGQEYVPKSFDEAEQIALKDLKKKK